MAITDIQMPIMNGLEMVAEYILNQKSSFMFIVNDGNTNYANEQLMHLLGIKEYREIHDEPLYILEEQTLKRQENWIAYIQEHQDVRYTVSFEGRKKRYALTYRHFDEIKKSVFSFAEITAADYLERREQYVEKS